jgi:hypothetical protein
MLSEGLTPEEETAEALIAFGLAHTHRVAAGRPTGQADAVGGVAE